MALDTQGPLAGAALDHQFVRKDGLLRRMWFGRREGGQ
jgi:hypothetical protein